MSSSYRQELDRWLVQLQVRADTVIDIGGSQLPVKGRTYLWDVKNYYIADIEDPHKESKKPDIIVDLNGYAETKIKADLVFCLEVFEYVYDPVNAMHIISRLLKPGGEAWVSFPLVYPVHNPVSDDFLRYTIQGVERLANVSGLLLSHYQVRRPVGDLTGFYRGEGMKAAKDIDHNVTGYIAKLRRPV